MDDRPLAELIHRYLDGTLSDSEFRVLNDLLRGDPVVAREFARTAHLHNQLHDKFAVGLPGMAQPFRAAQGSRSRRWIVGGLCVAALCAACVFVDWRAPSPTAAIGILADSQGDVHLENSAGALRPAISGTAVHRGDRIVTSGMNTDARLQLSDGSQLAIQGNAALRCGDNGQPQTFFLDAGQISASVSPQRDGAPFRIASATALVEVLGTKFVVWAASDRTEVDVTEGRVAVTSTADGRTVQVSPGRRALVSVDHGLRLQDRPTLATTWEADFEHGIPAGWHADPVTTGLPEGSFVAARAKYDSNYGGHFMLGVRGDPEGLFQVTPTSHVHVTFKVADRSPRWLNFFLFTCAQGPAGPNFTSHKSLSISESHPRPGTWQTITIPLSDFHDRSSTDRDPHPWTGPSPKPEDTLYALSIGAPPPDRGLIVDRIWVTPDGPGRVVLERGK